MRHARRGRGSFKAELWRVSQHPRLVSDYLYLFSRMEQQGPALPWAQESAGEQQAGAALPWAQQTAHDQHGQDPVDPDLPATLGLSPGDRLEVLWEVTDNETGDSTRKVGLCSAAAAARLQCPCQGASHCQYRCVALERKPVLCWALQWWGAELSRREETIDGEGRAVYVLR